MIQGPYSWFLDSGDKTGPTTSLEDMKCRDVKKKSAECKLKGVEPLGFSKCQEVITHTTVAQMVKKRVGAMAACQDNRKQKHQTTPKHRHLNLKPGVDVVV